MERSPPANRTSAYRREGERVPPTVFVGREFEISEVIERAKDVCEAVKPGRTVVIQGPTGAGKTALLREIAKRFQGLDARNRVIGPLRPWNAVGQSTALANLARALFGIDPAAFRHRQERRTAALGVSAELRGETSNSRSQTIAPPAVAEWDASFWSSPSGPRWGRCWCWWTKRRRSCRTAVCCSTCTTKRPSRCRSSAAACPIRKIGCAASA